LINSNFESVAVLAPEPTALQHCFAVNGSRRRRSAAHQLFGESERQDAHLFDFWLRVLGNTN